MSLIGFIFWFLFICWVLSHTGGRAEGPPPVNVQVTVVNQVNQPPQEPHQGPHTLVNNDYLRRF